MNNAAIIALGITAVIQGLSILSLMRQRDKYREVWKSELETTACIRKKRAELSIENVGLRAEVVRLKTARDATERLLAKSRIHLAE